MRHDVFISHSAKDQAVACQICDKLEKNDIRCWIAPRDVAVGSMYGGAIIEALSASRAMVFIFSSYSNQSPHVLRELERAVSKGVLIMPFCIEDVQPGPSIEYFITSAHWLNAFAGAMDGHIERLLQALRRLLEQGLNDTPPDVELDSALQRHTFAPPSPTSSNEFERDLAHVEALLEKKDWCGTVRVCEQILEKALKKLIKDVQEGGEDAQLIENVLAAERHIGRGRRSVDYFDLDEMVHLYLDTDFFAVLRRRLTSNLQKIKQVDWDKLALCCDDAKNPRLSQGIGKEDTTEIVYWTKLFLYDCELVGAKQDVPPVAKEERNLTTCPMCGVAVAGDWNYCPMCGAVLKLICQACHRALASAFRICPYCETRVQRQTIGETDEHRCACEEYRILCAGAYLDGVVNVREREVLSNKRLTLGLRVEEADEIERQYAPLSVVEYIRLVEGVLVDNRIDENERVFLATKAKELGIDEWVARQVELVVMKTKGLMDRNAAV